MSAAYELAEAIWDRTTGPIFDSAEFEKRFQQLWGIPPEQLAPVLQHVISRVQPVLAAERERVIALVCGTLVHTPEDVTARALALVRRAEDPEAEQLLQGTNNLVAEEFTKILRPLFVELNSGPLIQRVKGDLS